MRHYTLESCVVQIETRSIAPKTVFEDQILPPSGFWSEQHRIQLNSALQHRNNANILPQCEQYCETKCEQNIPISIGYV